VFAYVLHGGVVEWTLTFVHGPLCRQRVFFAGDNARGEAVWWLSAGGALDDNMHGVEL
jgi:hypothetical protein